MESNHPGPEKKSEKLLTFSSGGWVLLIAAFLTLVAAALVLYPVWTTGFHPSIGDGKNPDTYGFDLSHLTIPRDQLVASGYAKDEIHAVPPSLVETVSPAEVDLIAQNEHIRFVVPADPVIGVVADGIARAYPVRIMNLHEVVNDTMNELPIAVTWSPLCGSAVVFDRQIDDKGPPAEFGVSGLLYQQNLIMFDRSSNPKDESLWVQLSFHAIAGPSAGKSLRIIPSQFTTWGEWRAAHPGTRVFLGLRTLKAQYGDAQDPYNIYFANDDLKKFPVSPLWNNPKFPKKTPILVTSTDLTHFKASPAPALTPEPATFTATNPSSNTATATSPAAPYEIRTFLFAWYAQHPNDTDFSAFK